MQAAALEGIGDVSGVVAGEKTMGEVRALMVPISEWISGSPTGSPAAGIQTRNLIYRFHRSTGWRLAPAAWPSAAAAARESLRVENIAKLVQPFDRFGEALGPFSKSPSFSLEYLVYNNCLPYFHSYSALASSSPS